MIGEELSFFTMLFKIGCSTVVQRLALAPHMESPLAG